MREFIGFWVIVVGAIVLFTDVTIVDVTTSIENAFGVVRTDSTETMNVPEDGTDEKLSLKMTVEEAAEYGLKPYPQTLVDLGEVLKDHISKCNDYEYYDTIFGRVIFENGTLVSFNYNKKINRFELVGYQEFEEIENLGEWKLITTQTQTIERN